MNTRKRLTTAVIILLALLPVTPAFAGGWVVITLDSLPGEVRAGETVHIGFMVRQHGVRPTDAVSPALTATNRDTGETIIVEAEQSGATGHYEVAALFPAEGVWEWQLAAPPFPQQTQLEPLTVLPAAAAEAAAPLGVTGSARSFLRLSGAGLLVLAAVLILLGQRQRPEAVAPALEHVGGDHG